MKKERIVISAILFVITCFSANGQTVQVKHVAANAGSIKITSNYSTISVAGEMAVGRFTGIQSGTIGYLDEDDLQKTDIPVVGSSVYQVKIYPNPNKGSFDVAITTQEVITMNIALIDNVGRLYNTRAVKLVPGTNTVDYKDIPPGVWLLKLSSARGGMTREVVVLN